MQKRLKQTKVQQAFSYIIWKETTYKPLKVAPAKTLFSSLYIIGTICFDECFLFYVINGQHYFHESLPLVWYFFKRYVAAISAIKIWW